jgi:hypothetical protein
MMPRREAFIRDVRQALRDLQPTAVQYLEGVRPPRLLHLDAWARTSVVKHFDPADFANDDPQGRLVKAVEQFRAIVAQIPPHAPVTEQQRRDGEDILRELGQVVRAIVLKEWQTAASELIGTTEKWCAELKWRTRGQTKKLSETLLDCYQLPQLLIYAEEELFVLSPIARFIPDGMGAYQLSLQPSFELSSIYRDFDGVWYGHVDLIHGQVHARREPWSQDILEACVRELKSLA